MKMNSVNNYLAAFFLVLAFVASSCEKEKHPVTTGKYSKGILITNEGPFMDGTGTVSFYDPEKKLIENDIFQSVNGRPLGNIVQSAEAFEDRIYIVVNNAGKIEVVDQGTFESLGVIEGLVSPRYFVGLNSTKGYVSDWAGHVSILDLKTMTATGNIMAGSSPDRMLLSDNRLWVVNSAGWASDSTITVIDTQTDQVLQTFVVGDNPAGIVKDSNGKIWVLCGGIFDWQNPANNTNGSLVRINPLSFVVELRVELSGSDFGPRLAIDGSGKKIYFSFKGVIYLVDVDAAIPIQPEILLTRLTYALAIDPQRGDIYLSDPLDFARPGKLLRYNDMGNALIDSVSVGIIPGNLLFLN